MGNRSILCNPLNLKMRQILNEKVKDRYRPFAPVSTVESLNYTSLMIMKYHTCLLFATLKMNIRIRYQLLLMLMEVLIETVSKIQMNSCGTLLMSLKNFLDLILLNTSFNPGGEPILNYCHVGLSMLDKTDLDFVLIDDTVFVKKVIQRN